MEAAFTQQPGSGGFPNAEALASHLDGARFCRDLGKNALLLLGERGDASDPPTFAAAGSKEQDLLEDQAGSPDAQVEVCRRVGDRARPTMNVLKNRHLQRRQAEGSGDPIEPVGRNSCVFDLCHYWRP
jgi:hypothetical protein